ncbi:hypothetical protein AQUCO_06200007v1 [Aquilegia coerulea]|uniref:Uncharacterized protein n=1 Tax=Aquilegia coerulea TaxID=218851 RepID=A0A2G5CCW9_AQUCA|nr:hypothetical protein AQUCO_06200007v1 [Aquilegia coerulea]
MAFLTKFVGSISSFYFFIYFYPKFVDMSFDVFMLMISILCGEMVWHFSSSVRLRVEEDYPIYFFQSL